MRRLPGVTERDGLLLRRWVPSEVEALHEAVVANVEHLRPWMSWARFEPMTLAQRTTMLEQRDREWREGGEAMMAMWRNGVVVGSCGLHPRVGPGALEIGYWVHGDHVGQGIATTAARVLTDLAFTVEGIERVEIHHDVANRASRRIPEKLGFALLTDTAAPDEPLSPGETGRDCIWQMTRAAWRA